jgi:hypothetical protein
VERVGRREVSGLLDPTASHHILGWAHNPKVVGSNPTDDLNIDQFLGESFERRLEKWACLG